MTCELCKNQTATYCPNCSPKTFTGEIPQNKSTNKEDWEKDLKPMLREYFWLIDENKMGEEEFVVGMLDRFDRIKVEAEQKGYFRRGEEIKEWAEKHWDARDGIRAIQLEDLIKFLTPNK